MSPELETLDQLLGGDLTLALIRSFFEDEKRFAQAITAMLNAGEVRMLAIDGTELHSWQWRDVLSLGSGEAIRTQTLLSITESGCRRID
jgi:hypothetical protein